MTVISQLSPQTLYIYINWFYLLSYTPKNNGNSKVKEILKIDKSSYGNSTDNFLWIKPFLQSISVQQMKSNGYILMFISFVLKKSLESQW